VKQGVQGMDGCGTHTTQQLHQQCRESEGEEAHSTELAQLLLLSRQALHCTALPPHPPASESGVIMTQ
jgi:hypothetical protein